MWSEKHSRAHNTEAQTMLQRWEYLRLLGCPASLFKKPWERPHAYCQSSHSGADGVPKLSHPADIWLFSEKSTLYKSSHIRMYAKNQRPEVEWPGPATYKTRLYTSHQGHHLWRTSPIHSPLITEQSARDQETFTFFWETCRLLQSSWTGNIPETHWRVKVI